MRIIIFGAGAQALVDIGTICREGKHVIDGLVDNQLEPGSTFAGYPVLGGDDELGRIVGDVGGGIISIGDNAGRGDLAARIALEWPDFEFVSIVDPFTAVAADAVIGPGTRVTAGVVINPGSRIGAHCIINTRASIDHENTVGDFVSINPGSVTGGKVSIGDYSVLGLGAQVIHQVTIGAHTIVGAGSRVIRDLPDHVVAFGSPAKTVRSRETGESYL